MYTISAEELLKAYNGKYKYVTMDEDGEVCLFSAKPIIWNSEWTRKDTDSAVVVIGKIAITEFQGKDWTECIYKAKPSEEDMIGCVGWFWDGDLHTTTLCLGILSGIDMDDGRRYLREIGFPWEHFRPATRDEIKFFNDDTEE